MYGGAFPRGATRAAEECRVALRRAGREKMIYKQKTSGPHRAADRKVFA
jgi:hypothetical protein